MAIKYRRDIAVHSDTMNQKIPSVIHRAIQKEHETV